MEYLEGGTLKEFINDKKKEINEDICRIIIKQILSALSHLFRKLWFFNLYVSRTNIK